MSASRSVSNPSSLKALEWESIRSLLARRASRDANREGFRNLDPGTLSREEVDRSFARIRVFASLLGESPLRFDSIPEIGGLCDGLSVEGAVLDSIELLSLARFAESAAELGHATAVRFDGSNPNASGFVEEAGELERIASLAFVQSVSRAIGPKGEIRDDASPELRRLRARANRLKEDLEIVFDTYLKKPNADDVLQDKVVASRNGRSVLMVKAEAKRTFQGGVVHGSSRAEKTTFIEPLEAVAVNNEIVVVSEEEQEEIRQILRKLSGEARADLSSLRRADTIVERWDSLHAKARLAHDLDAESPSFSSDGSLTVVKARHPLLIDRLRADLELRATGREAVPLDLSTTGSKRILVIGGPNTGGKTVALKTVGLLCLMARTGLPVPAAAGTTVPFYDRVFAEIGDDQSLGAGLSTFSAQIAGIAQMEFAETERALVLLDELGSGTDPLEGGALGAAVVDDFARRGATVIATTHNADLKLFAQESSRGRCASFAYDARSFAPTFTLVPDQPGRSLAFEIAARLGVATSVVAAARARLPETARRQEAILADLAREKRELEEAQRTAAASREEAAATRKALDDRLASISAERERMRDESKREIEVLQQTEATRLRELFADAERRLREAKSDRAVARLRVETLRAVAPLVQGADTAAPTDAIGVNDYVEAPSLGWRGRVVSAANHDVEIDSGGKRIRLARNLVRRTEAPKGHDARSRGPSNDGGGPKEIMLVGMRVDEAIPRVDKFLDDAFLADVSSIRVVHGFGQGRLRTAVRDLLKSHPHVTSFRDGAPSEGGGGVTIVELRT